MRVSTHIRPFSATQLHDCISETDSGSKQLSNISSPLTTHDLHKATYTRTGRAKKRTIFKSLQRLYMMTQKGMPYSKMFSSLSGVRLECCMSPCLNSLCTSCCGKYYTKNNNSPITLCLLTCAEPQESIKRKRATK